MPSETESSDVSAGVSESDSAAGGLLPKENSLLRALDLVSADEFGQVVEDALKAPRSGAVRAARQSLDAAVDACNVKVRGVRRGKASKASHTQLKDLVTEECDGYDNVRMLGALLRTWHACKAALRDKVADHLQSAGVAAEPVDFKEGWYHSFWRPEDWERHVAALLECDDGADSEETGNSRRCAAETRLMLSLVSGASPAEPGDLSAGKFKDPELAEILTRLWTFKSREPIWEEMDSFIEELGELNDLRGRELIEEQIAACKQALEELDNKYGKSLAYLESDLGRIRSAMDEDEELLLSTGDDIYPQLAESLGEYESIRHQGETKSEERERAAKRVPLEEKIVDLVKQWEDEIVEQQSELSEQDSEADDNLEDLNGDASPAADDFSKDEKILALENRLEAKTRKCEEYKSRLTAQTSELRGLRQISRSAESKNKRLEKENLELKNRLDGTAETDTRDSTTAVEEAKVEYFVRYSPQRIDSVKDAVSQAERTYESELVFALNAKSQQNSAFDGPDEVFKALAWLAMEFRAGKLNPGIGVNLNEALEKSLKESVKPNWSYTPRQSQTARGKKPEAYITTHQGKAYDLHEHIGRGRSYNAKGNIRIAFAWDEDGKKLIIGYIGRHQPTGRSS